MFRVDCFNYLHLAWGAFVLSVSMALWTPVDLLAQEQENALDQELSQRWANSIQPLLKEHCGSCHMNSANEGGVDLDDYQDLAKIRLHTSTWEQVRGVIRAEAMPPPEESRISPEQRVQLAAWIEQAFVRGTSTGCDLAKTESDRIRQYGSRSTFGRPESVSQNKLCFR